MLCLRQPLRRRLSRRAGVQTPVRLKRRRTDRGALTPKVDVTPRGESGGLGKHAQDASRRLWYCLDAQLKCPLCETACYQLIRRREWIGTGIGSGCESFGAVASPAG